MRRAGCRHGLCGESSQGTRARHWRPNEGPTCKASFGDVPITVDAEYAWTSYVRPIIDQSQGSLRYSEAFRQLTPAWKVMLLSDGSVTRHLELLTGEDAIVDCLEMAPLQGSAGRGPDTHIVPSVAELMTPPLFRRQVLLRCGSSIAPGTNSAVDRTALVFAASWWPQHAAERHLTEVSQPIWSSLVSSRTAVFRELKCILHGSNEQLEVAFGEPGPFWAREYVFWHDGQPLTVIHEAFSPALSEYLGPCKGLSSSAVVPAATLRWELDEK